MTINSLPNREISFNEKEKLAQTGLEAIPVSSMPAGDPKNPEISDIVLITSETIYGLYFNGESWESVDREKKPDGAFEGEFFTNEDHNHEEYKSVVESVKERIARSE